MKSVDNLNYLCYETIDHDLREAMDKFQNFKFCYFEKATKLDLLSNFFHERESVVEILEESKKRAMKSDEIIDKLEEEILFLSREIYKQRGISEKNQREIKELAREREVLAIELMDEEKHAFRMEVAGELEKEMLEVEKELIKNIEILNEPELQDDTEKINEEIKILKEEKKDLISKQRRISQVNYENCLEDLQSWYFTATKFINKLLSFRLISYNTNDLESNELEIELEVNNFRFVLLIKNGKFYEVNFKHTIDGIKLKDIVKLSVDQNNPKILLNHLISK